MICSGQVCAKFDTKLKSIIRVDGLSCGNSTDGCPYSYQSTKTYLCKHVLFSLSIKFIIWDSMQENLEFILYRKMLQMQINWIGQ